MKALTAASAPIAICGNGLDKGGESSPGLRNLLTLHVSHGPSPLLRFTALSPRFSLLLLFYKVVENNVAGNCVDGQDLLPVTEDHKIQVRIRSRDESTRAVRIYGVGTRNIHWRD